jgi:hypothetical protein
MSILHQFKYLFTINIYIGVLWEMDISNKPADIYLPETVELI